MCKIVKSGTTSGKNYIVFDSASIVRYDLNLTLGCHRFYDLAPLPVLDPIYHRDTFNNHQYAFNMYRDIFYKHCATFNKHRYTHC